MPEKGVEEKEIRDEQKDHREEAASFLFLVPFSLLPAFNHLLGEMTRREAREGDD